MNTIGPHLLPNKRDRLNSDLSGAVATVSSLREEMLSLQTELHSVGIELYMFTARFTSEFVYREGLMCVCEMRKREREREKEREKEREREREGGKKKGGWGGRGKRE